MDRANVKIKSIIIENFKNVSFGTIDFEGSKKYKSSVLGLYGQNGSGKTALIDALRILKYVLCGMPVPPKYSDYINTDADHSHFRVELSVNLSSPDILYDVIYDYSIRKIADVVSNNTGLNEYGQAQYKIEIFDEVLSYSYIGDGLKSIMQPVIDTRTDEVFVPRTKYDVLTNKNKEVVTDLLVAKKIAKATSRSFIFSGDLLNVIRINCKEVHHVALINAVVEYGNNCMFVIDTADSGLISLNALPLSLKYEGKGHGIIGQMMIPLDGNALIPEDAYDIFTEVINNMNIVMTQLIPGLTIGIENLGTQMLPDGKIGKRIQLMSQKGGRIIPFMYESEGIKKIFAILQLLIVVYNNPSITVAIDELDSGVFEYLLGEILRIISEKGKGQLIFTSHNLRPLETLDKCFVAFTTTNPDNRYIRLVNVKSNNNLRDFYYRDIMLCEQAEPVYETTNNREISLAFREAGELIGS